MHRQYFNFPYQSSKLHYSVFGQGEIPLLMFHGFGHTIKNMKCLEQALQYDYKIYSFDLFFHGFSEWNREDTPLTDAYWKELLQAFLLENNIQKFSILGFSLGAKISLSTLNSFREQVQSVFLIAPDGIKPNFWYQLATSWLFKTLFKRTIQHPDLFLNLVSFLSKFRLVHKSVLRFATIQMNSREKRRRVYYTWTVYSGLQPAIQKIEEFLKIKPVPVTLYIGRYDRIIQYTHIQKFSENVPSVRLVELNCGHNNLLEEVATQFEKDFQKG